MLPAGGGIQLAQDVKRLDRARQGEARHETRMVAPDWPKRKLTRGMQSKALALAPSASRPTPSESDHGLLCVLAPSRPCVSRFSPPPSLW